MHVIITCSIVRVNWSGCSELECDENNFRLEEETNSQFDSLGMITNDPLYATLDLEPIQNHNQGT